jgi:hypothetical protein
MFLVLTVSSANHGKSVCSCCGPCKHCQFLLSDGVHLALPVGGWANYPPIGHHPARRRPPARYPSPSSLQAASLLSSLRARSAAAPPAPPVRRDGAVGRPGGRRAREAGDQEPAACHAPHRARAAARGPGDLCWPGALGPRCRRDPARPRNPPQMARRRSVPSKPSSPPSLAHAKIVVIVCSFLSFFMNERCSLLLYFPPTYGHVRFA